MPKTTTPIYLPLSRHAVRWLPERNGAEDGLHVFAGLPAEPYTKWPIHSSLSPGSRSITGTSTIV